MNLKHGVRNSNEFLSRRRQINSPLLKSKSILTELEMRQIRLDESLTKPNDLRITDIVKEVNATDQQK